jgi:hypothetical protein
MRLAERSELWAPAACALCALLLAAALVVGWAGDHLRGASIAAAAAFVVIVAVGVYLYAWRLGVSGRSDHRASRPR